MGRNEKSAKHIWYELNKQNIVSGFIFSYEKTDELTSSSNKVVNCEINYRIYFNKMTVNDFFSHLLQFSKVGGLIKNKTLHDLFYFYFIFTEIRGGGFVNHLIKK